MPKVKECSGASAGFKKEDYSYAMYTILKNFHSFWQSLFSFRISR